MIAASSVRRWSALVCLGMLWTAPAHAQVVINGGATWLGAYPIGVSSAELRRNAPGSAPPPFTLFTVDSRMDDGVAGELRVGVEVGAGFTVEGSAAFARRRLSFTISADPEAASQQLAGESIQHYEFGGALTWQLPRLQTERLRTFLAGGATYLRQLHQDRTLVETGQVYYGGGGVRYWLWGRPESARGFGLRGDVRYNVRTRAIDFDDEARRYPSLSLLAFFAL